MESTTPEKLFVCLYKIAPSLTEAIGKFYTEGTPLPAELQAVRENHLRYQYDMSIKDMMWAGGPAADPTRGLNIFAVDSLEEARKAQQNDPYSVHGLFYDDEYFEWTVHMPLGKTAPAHRERLEASLRSLGILK